MFNRCYYIILGNTDSNQQLSDKRRVLVLAPPDTYGKVASAAIQQPFCNRGTITNRSIRTWFSVSFSVRTLSFDGNNIEKWFFSTNPTGSAKLPINRVIVVFVWCVWLNPINKFRRSVLTQSSLTLSNVCCLSNCHCNFQTDSDRNPPTGPDTISSQINN